VLSWEKPDTTVIGPVTCDSVCLVYLRTRLLIKVVLPTYSLDVTSKENYPRRSNNSDNHWRRLLGCAIHHWNMKSLFRHL